MMSCFCLRVLVCKRDLSSCITWMEEHVVSLGAADIAEDAGVSGGGSAGDDDEEIFGMRGWSSSSSNASDGTEEEVVEAAAASAAGAGVFADPEDAEQCLECDLAPAPPAAPAAGPSLPAHESVEECGAAPAPPAVIDEPPSAPAAAAGVVARMPGIPAQYMEQFPEGKITYYINGTREFIEVRCNNPLHVGCVLTRTMKANRANTGSQGRPLGLAMAWLKKGSALPNKAAHRQVEVTFAERREGRTLLK